MAHIIPVRFDDDAQQQLAADMHDQLEAAGISTLLDDRDRQAGEKFADADLLGAPYRITVASSAPGGMVELRPRHGGKLKSCPWRH